MYGERRSSRGSEVIRAIALASAALLCLVASSTPVAAGGETLRVPVLMYHRIKAPASDARLPELWVAPQRFRAQLRTLARHGWRTVTATELTRAALSGRSVGPKRFVITFDDGARDGYRYAAPIMARFGMRGTYCVVPGRSRLPWQLSVRQLAALHDAGHEIANHTLSHADLPSLGEAALRREVLRGRQLIERFVGEAPRTLCYPYGHQDARVRRVVARTGHLAAFTTMDGAAQLPSERMRWPRIRVNGSDSAAELLARMRPFAIGGGPEPLSHEGDPIVRIAAADSPFAPVKAGAAAPLAR